MQIYIDADACPVVALTISIAKEYNVPVVLICDTSHVLEKYDAQIITVEKGADSADLKLANKVSKEDIVVTQDYGLAALCLGKGTVALNQNGLIYTNDNIDSLLFSRYANKKQRMQGKRIKGPKKRSEQNNIDFKNALISILEQKKNA